MSFWQVILIDDWELRHRENVGKLNISHKNASLEYKQTYAKIAVALDIFKICRSKIIS